MKLFLLLIGLFSTTQGYHILCVFPVPSHSHNQLGRGVVNALLDHGHTVTWVTPYPEKVGKNPPKTLNIIDVSEIQQFVSGIDMSSKEQINKGIAFVKEFSNNITKTTLANQAVRDAIVKTQFDAVATESFFSDVMAGVAAVQQVPWILLNPTSLFPNVEEQVDQVRSISTIPLIFNEAGTPMNFIERAKNGIIYTFMAIGSWIERPAISALYEKIFSPLAAARNVPLPPFADAFYNVSILLVNAHESVSTPYSVPPNVINIAGYHIDQNPPPLPKDLQDLLDNSKQGVIYFSMGSVVRSAALKPHTRKALLAKFAALPYTVLWKFEEQMDEKLPPNVHVRPWMPQPSILAHPNIKAFITHGGQLSRLEAVHNGVPLLAVPVFGDQPANAEMARRAGYALRVNFDPDMADELDAKLKELLSNPSYTQRVKYLSKLFRGRPVHPSKLIAHYVELAIETRGAYHLRSLSLQYSWIERWMLDVILLVLGILYIILWVLKVIAKSCYAKICGSEKNTQKKRDSKKKRN